MSKKRRKGRRGERLRLTRSLGPLRPQKYADRFFQETARRMNYAIRLERHSFDAFRLLRDLRDFLTGSTTGPLRRA